MDNLHWSHILPTPSTIADEFYTQPNHLPPPLDLPKDYQCKTFTFPWATLPEDLEKELIIFVENHNQVGKYNTTILDQNIINRFKKMGACLAVLFHNDIVIGTMISLGFRCHYHTKEIYTSYTTFLCVHKQYRENGLAIILIQAIMQYGKKHNIYSGYYISDIPHQPNRNIVENWYRPVNFGRARKAGYSLLDLPKTTNHVNINRRYRLMYHIPDVNIPEKIKRPTTDIYNKMINFFVCESLHLAPTQEELNWYCNFFDVYLFEKGVLMLLPLSIKVSSSQRIVKNIYLVYMSTDLFQEALSIAKNGDYDLLVGLYVGNVTKELVEKYHGHQTLANSYLEFYNTSKDVKIPPESFYLPIF